MIEVIRSVLRKLGIYNALRDSIVHDAYLYIFRSELIADRKRQLAFYRQTLPPLGTGDIVFDIGANEGQKAAIFLALGAHVICVEPDRSNVARLSRRFVRKPVTAISVTTAPGTKVSSIIRIFSSRDQRDVGAQRRSELQPASTDLKASLKAIYFVSACHWTRRFSPEAYVRTGVAPGQNPADPLWPPRGQAT
jgi:FkbM family methyltransferase